MKIGSLFSGIGGMEIGLEAAGVGKTAWQVEKDSFCRAVLEKHWPDVRRYEDVCAVGAHDLEPVEVIAGGFPCQDISNAGKQAGLKGARSGLWFEYARIVEEVRPRFVVVENVAALVNRGLDEVLRSLAALGYDAEWSVLRASDVGRILGDDRYGARHRRERLFLIAWRCDVAVSDGKHQPQKHEGIDGFDEQRASERGRKFVAAGPRAVHRDLDRHRAVGTTLDRQVTASHGRADPTPVADATTRGFRPEARALLADASRGHGSRPSGSDDNRGGAHRALDGAGLLDVAPDQGRGGGAALDERPAQASLGGVGVAVDGLLSRLDVARPGEEQRAWEAPRTVVEQQDRAKRLRALGNAVVPAAAYVVGLRLLQIQQALDEGREP